MPTQIGFEFPRGEAKDEHQAMWREAHVKSLLAALVARAVSALQDWCECWPRFETMSRDWQRRRLCEAREADHWLLAQVDRSGDPGLTFQDVTEALGLDADWCVERVYATLDRACVDALWSHPGIPDGRSGRPRSATAGVTAGAA